jgi:tetratricopeptide (TPR) repeat protein
VVALEGVDPAIVKAVEAAQFKVRLLPWSATAWGRLGSVLYMHDYNAQADLCYAQAMWLDPREARWPYLRARSRAEQDPEGALPLLERAVELTGDQAAAPRLQLAEMLLERGRVDEAEGHFRHVLELQPADARACLGMGRVAVAQGRWTEGRDYLCRAADAAPQVKAAQVLLALVYQRLGEKDFAEWSLNRAADLDEYPAWPDPFLGEAMALRVGLEADLSRARRLHQERKLDEEISLLRRVVEAYPDCDRAWEKLGSAYDQSGQPSAAEQALGTAVRLAPTSVVARMQQGANYFRQGKNADAIASYREALRLKPDLATGYFNLGMCLSRNGDRAGAAEALREAVRLKPDLAAAHVELGQIQVSEGKAAAAMESLREALRLKPLDSRAKELLDEARRMAEGRSSP